MANIKAAIIGDTHIGFRQYRLEERKHDFILALERAINTCKQERVDVICFVGDIFNHPRPAAEDFLAVYKIISSCDIPILSIDGNHDSSNNIWQLLCGMIPIHNTTKQITVAGGTLTVAGINYTNKLDLEDTVGTLMDANKDSGIDILLMHQGLAEWVPHETAGDISALDLATMVKQAGVKCVCLGHIHRQQILTYGGIKFISTGSTERWSITEQDNKSFTIIDFDTVTRTTEETIVPIQTRVFRFIEVNTAEDIESVEKLVNDGAMYLISYSRELLDVKKRLVTKLNTGFMYRLLPMFDDLGIEYNKEESLDLLHFQDIIKLTHKEDSDEFNLILALLQEPHKVATIVCGYLENKGVICA